MQGQVTSEVVVKIRRRYQSRRIFPNNNNPISLPVQVRSAGRAYVWPPRCQLLNLVQKRDYKNGGANRLPILPAGMREYKDFFQCATQCREGKGVVIVAAERIGIAHLRILSEKRLTRPAKGIFDHAGLACVLVKASSRSGRRACRACSKPSKTHRALLIVFEPTSQVRPCDWFDLHSRLIRAASNYESPTYM